MKILQANSNYLIIIFSFFVLAYLFQIFTYQPIENIVTNENSKELIEKQNKIQKTYQKNMEVLSLKNDSLQGQLDKSLTALNQQRKQVKTLEIDLKKALMEDTNSGYENVKSKTLDYIVQTHVLDTNCDAVIQTLEEVVQIKDSVINECNLCLYQTDSLLDVSLEQQRILEQNLKRQNKQLKKSKRNEKILLIGTIILTGITLAK